MRSHLSDGSLVAWTPPAGVCGAAIDAELTGSAAGRLALSRALELVPDARSGTDAWTRLEVEAKLAEQPVVVLLHDPALRPDASQLRLETIRCSDLVFTLGCWAPGRP